MQSITDDKGFIFHHEPDTSWLYYLSWCHGPAGTLRLYHLLAPKNKSFEAAAFRSVNALLNSGLPAKNTARSWNNVGQCCGVTGIADCMLRMHQVYDNDDYLDFAYKITDDLLNRATVSEEGLKWIQAEHRVRPDLLQAQTGYTQGTAGIGLYLLHLDAFEEGREAQIKLPDNPF